MLPGTGSIEKFASLTAIILNLPIRLARAGQNELDKAYYPPLELNQIIK